MLAFCGVGILPITEAQSNRPPAKLVVTSESVTLHDGGFYPASITRKSGKFMLIVRNVSRTREASLRVSRNNQRVLDAAVKRETAEWAGVVDLPAGVYKVTDTANPEREFTLTITN